MYLVINISSSYYRDKQISILYHILSNKSIVNYDPHRCTLVWSRKKYEREPCLDRPLLIKATLVPTSSQIYHMLSFFSSVVSL